MLVFVAVALALGSALVLHHVFSVDMNQSVLAVLTRRWTDWWKSRRLWVIQEDLLAPVVFLVHWVQLRLMRRQVKKDIAAVCDLAKRLKEGR